MVTDPVCKMEIDENAARHSFVFEGETHFFCSEGCQAEFIRHPLDYSDPTPVLGDDPADGGQNV